MSWYEIRLELARTQEFPEGSADHGYQLRVPLDLKWHLDEQLWRDHKDKATVHRFWSGEADQYGRLIHTRHRTWAFSYAPGEDDDTPLFHLEDHLLKAGEYVSIREHNGETAPFKVVEVRPLIGYP